MPDKFDPDERIKIDTGDEEPEASDSSRSRSANWITVIPIHRLSAGGVTVKPLVAPRFRQTGEADDRALLVGR
jgi:hypothetical protein